MSMGSTVREVLDMIESERSHDERIRKAQEQGLFVLDDSNYDDYVYRYHKSIFEHLRAKGVRLEDYSDMAVEDMVKTLRKEHPDW